MMRHIIGLGGKAGSGKTTAASYLELLGYDIVAFADALKEVAQKIFTFTPQQLYGGLKEIPDPRFNKSPRYCLQKIGMTCRELWPDVWVQHVRNYLQNSQGPVVIHDVRMHNEACMLKQEFNATMIHIYREGAGAVNGIPNHISEIELDAWQGWDFVIRNNGSKEELYDQIDAILSIVQDIKWITDSVFKGRNIEYCE
jgi:hypothetical protein